MIKHKEMFVRDTDKQEDLFEAAKQVYHHGLLTQRVTKHILVSGDETATGSSKKKEGNNESLYTVQQTNSQTFAGSDCGS